MEQKKKHLHTGHRQRVKNKAFEAGIEHWPEHEVLELILMYSIPQKDVNPLAHTLIEHFGSLGSVLDAGYEQLKKVKGISHETALYLSLLPEFFVKYTASKNVGDIIMSDAHTCVTYFRSIDRIRSVENFYIFCLNNNKRLLKTVKVNSDFASQVSVDMRSFAENILFPANNCIVILHTHPSGNSQPTQKDVYATLHLLKACQSWGIKIDDHIIATETEFFSFYNSGILEDLRKGVLPKFYNQLRKDDDSVN